MKLKYYLVAAMLFIATALSAQIVNVDKPLKILHGPYLQNVKENEATIVWVTSDPSVGWVEIAPNDDTHFYSEERAKYWNNEMGIKKIGTIHAVKIKNLEPGTTYRYRVCSKSVLFQKGSRVFYGQNASSDVYSVAPPTFTTLDPNDKDISFVVVNDVHAKDTAMATLLNHCDVTKRDMVFFNGDMVNIYDYDWKLYDGFLDMSVKMFAKSIPFYFCRGNHETRGKEAYRFQEHFSPLEPKPYFAFSAGPVYFIVLDAGEDKPDSDVEYYDLTCYDEYRAEQAEWMKEVIKSDEYKNAKYKVVITHIPPIGNWHGTNQIRDIYMPIIAEGKADIVICGHTHKAYHYEPTTEAPYHLLVNDHISAVRVDANQSVMKVEVVGMDGKVTNTIEIK
jgi:predicted phosphodiesterase